MDKTKAKQMELTLAEGGEDAAVIRAKLLARMSDVSEFIKALKQRFSVWYNRTHRRYGTIWAERFKSVLVEGEGNALQTMAAYIDLNPVRAGIVEDPKDYRFCGYAEAVAHSAGSGQATAEGLVRIWSDHLAGKASGTSAVQVALKAIEDEQGALSKATLLRCQVRYFTDGAILGSSEFVRGYSSAWQAERDR